jgi:hypothetical protein
MRKIYKITLIPIAILAFVLCSFTVEASNCDAAGVKAVYTVTFNINDNHGIPVTDAIITFDGIDYPAGQYSIDIEEGDYNYEVVKHGFVTAPLALITVDGPEAIDIVLTPVVEITYNELTSTIDYSWNQQIGTFDPGIFINGAPYNTDGGFILLKLYNDETGDLVPFGDMFDIFTIGGMNYHAGTSNRISADFWAEQYNGNWGTRVVSDNASYGGSLRNTALNGALFYGVMIDGTLGTVGFVAPTASGSDSQTFNYEFTDGVYGDYTLYIEFHVPWRPGGASSSDFYTFSEFESLNSYSTTVINFHLDSPEEIAIQHAIDNTNLTNSTNNIAITVGEDVDFNTTVDFAAFLPELPADMLVDGIIDFGQILPAGAIIDITNTSLVINGNVTADGLSSVYSFSDIFATPEDLITPKSGTQEIFSISISNLPADFYCVADLKLFMDDDFADVANQYLLAEDQMPISVYPAPVTYQIFTNVVGGSATIATTPATEAEEAEDVTVTISDIEVGKQFVSIDVIAEDLSIISTTIINPEIEYSFVMPAQDVEIIVTVEDIPVTYQITTIVMGGTATVTTAPAAIAEENDNVIVNISNIEVGKEFGMIEVWAEDVEIPTTEVLAGVEYSFTMPAIDVDVYVHLQDIVVDPIIITAQPQSAIICEGTFTVIAVTASATTAETLTYQWFFNSEILTDSIANSIIVSEAGSYYCQLTAGTDVLNSDVAIITVPLVNPILQANIVACDGTTVTLDPGTFASYAWNDLSTESTLEITLDGDYSVVVMDENGCTATAETNVDFADEITIDLGEDLFVCVGSTGEITAPVSDSYIWSGGEETQSITVSEAGEYSVTVTQGTCEASDIVTVEIIDLPPTFDLGETVYACEGTTYTIEGPEITDVDFLWSTDQFSENIDVTTPGTYSLTITNEHGCESSDDIEIEFNSFIIPNLHSSDSIYSCVGDVVTLDPQEGIEWLWSDGSDDSTLDVETSDWYFVTVTVDGGCEGEDSVYVLFHALPAIDLGANQAFCDGLSAVLTAPDAVEYIWSTSETTQSINITVDDDYSCTITDINGCQNSDEMSLNIYALPNVDLGADMIIDEDQTLILGTQQGHPEYLWSTGETTNFIVISAADLNLGINIISVTVTSSNDCAVEDELSITVIEGAGINSDIANSYSVYPNPTNGIIEIKGENFVSVSIFDYTGKEILSSKESRLDLSDFAKGIYIVKINTDTNTFSSKLILQ